VSAVERLRVALLLRACDRVGAHARLEGAPWIDNRGRLELGEGVSISSRPVQSRLLVARGALLRLGDGVRVGQGAAISAYARVEIGEGSTLGPFVAIEDTDYHVPGDRLATPRPAPVQIGRNVRIGARSTILRGAEIGDGAQVAAGSVVSGVVAPNAHVGGVPAMQLRAVGAEAGGPGAALDGSGVSARVVAVVQRVLGLREQPSLESGPAQIKQWDSLGALKLLLALEEDLGLSLGETAVAKARSVRDLVHAVEAARAAA